MCTFPYLTCAPNNEAQKCVSVTTISNSHTITQNGLQSQLHGFVNCYSRHLDSPRVFMAFVVVVVVVV